MKKSQFRKTLRKFICGVMTLATICGTVPGMTVPALAEEYGFVNPITGTVQGTGYDESSGHNGIDLYPYNYGDPVYAVAPGTITYSCEKNHTHAVQSGDDCGSVKILLDEPFTYNGYTYVSAFYTHMSELVYDIYCGFNNNCISDYESGERENALESGSVHVEAGDIIGYVGKGNAATHLHLSFETGEKSGYEMMPNSEYFDVFGWDYGDSIEAGETQNIPDTGEETNATGLTLAQLKAKFPAGAYWNGGNPDSYTWSPCVCHNRKTCGYASDCTCNGYTYGGVEYAWQCMGFAYTLQQLAYGGNPYAWKQNTNYANAMANLKPGDVVRYNGHSIFITYVSGNYIEYADCNSTVAGNCGIRWGAHNQTKSTLKNGFSYVTHAPYAIEGGTIIEESCNCSTSYAGTYICTTSKNPLTIRSGHGTNYSSIGSIPTGAKVTVTKANGNWAHVEYGGISGYASMEYLAKEYDPYSIYPVPFKCYPLSESNHAADAFDAVNGNHIGYIYSSDYCTIKEVYTNGWCKVNCPWGSSTRDVFTWTGNFLNTSCMPYLKVIEKKVTTYIRLNSSTELGWVDPGDKVTVVDDVYSNRKQIIYPHTDGIYRCAWIDATALEHIHTPGPAATCTSPQVCTTCDAILVGEKGHSAGAEATCTTDKICKVCGVILEVAKGHKLGVPATCTTPQTCTVCGAVITPAKGHSYTTGQYTDPVHPHRIYNTCVCGAREDTGRTATVPGCSECYPKPTNLSITYKPNTIYAGDSVTFTFNAQNADAYQLIIGDGINKIYDSNKVSNNEFTYIFDTEGNYSVWGYAYNGDNSEISETVHVNVGSAIIPVSGIELNKNNAEINVDESIVLTATVTPPNATDKSITWTSSNSSVAEVVDDIVTGLKPGTAIITAETNDGNYTAECRITVVEEEPDIPSDVPNISVSTATGRAGSTVDVTISIDKNPGIAGAILRVNYDPSLTLINVVSGEAFKTLTLAELAVPYMNPLVLSWDGMVADYNAGVLVTMTFEIPEGMEAGDYPITIDYDTDDIYDNELKDVPVSVRDGGINVADFIYGDANNDGKINGKDLTVIRRVLATGWDIEVYIKEAADVNLDGKVNGKDMTLIRRYISGGFDIILGK